MFWLIFILVILFTAGFWAGFGRKFQLRHLTKKRIANGLLALLLLLTVMSVASYFKILTQQYATYTTIGLYSIATGFFSGSGIKLMKSNREAGSLKYMHQSFWSHMAPNTLIIVIVAFGIYKTGLFTWNFTGIGVTSGLSLICFGLWGWTVNIVPQFRSKKILWLDLNIDWFKVTAYKWINEESLQVDYYNQEGLLTEFITYIPPEDQLKIERILVDKIKDKDLESENGSNPDQPRSR